MTNEAVAKLNKLYDEVRASVSQGNFPHGILVECQNEKEGEDFAVIVAQTTATTSVWDYLRSKETTTEAVTEGETVSVSDGSGTADIAEGEEASEAPVPTEAPTEPTDFVIRLD